MTLGTAGPEGEPFAGRVWLRKFPHGDVELLYRAGQSPGELERLNVWLEDAGIENRVTRLSPPGYGQQRDEPDREETAETNRERSTRRAKQAVRWATKAIGCDQMLTLTYRDNVEDLAESRKHFARFVAMCRKEWPTFRYVAAPERQQRGAWHWHVGVRGFVNYDKLRGFWWRAMGTAVQWSAEGKPILRYATETPGNVQGVAAKVRGTTRRSWSADRMAGYLAKYIAKSIGGIEDDGKSYSVSRGLKWVTERYAVRGFSFAAVASAAVSLLGAAGVVAPHWFQSSDRVILWAAGRAAEPQR